MLDAANKVAAVLASEKGNKGVAGLVNTRCVFGMLVVKMYQHSSRAACRDTLPPTPLHASLLVVVLCGCYGCR
jgi:hypothetical protein